MDGIEGKVASIGKVKKAKGKSTQNEVDAFNQWVEIYRVIMKKMREKGKKI